MCYLSCHFKCNYANRYCMRDGTWKSGRTNDSIPSGNDWINVSAVTNASRKIQMKCLASDSAQSSANFEDGNENTRRNRNRRCDYREDKCEQEISGEIEEDVSVRCAPIVLNRRLLNWQIFFCPSEICEQLADLLMRWQFTCNKLSCSNRIR